MKIILNNPSLFQNELQCSLIEFRPSETTFEENYTYEYFVKCLPARDLIPSAELLQLLPEIKGKTFMTPSLKNVQMQYDPPQISNFKLSQKSKQLDTQFSYIQYKLYGITRPVEGSKKVIFTTVDRLLVTRVHRGNYRDNIHKYKHKHKHNKHNRFKRNNKLNFLKVIRITFPILLGSKKESPDSSRRTAKLVLRDTEQDNHQQSGSESSNPVIQNPILLASSNQSQT
ncbi:hypothetical protein BB560_003984 [Smittium megazygosporum]|uniref:Uncharacterized protein n=1 Tax=Smittium megazygosporum TaxID=133381 RepID=A0A2T9ZAI8_9FUNG|nr:hypothetical protein BB560_003984 [Smittium megazygosporum]